MRKPFCASALTAAAMAEGVAKAKAHGQEITNTDKVMASARLESSCHQSVATADATNKIPSTKNDAILSANRTPAGFSDCARSISRTILNKVESFADFKVRTDKGASILSEPPYTVSPFCFNKGNASPVSSASSSELCPDKITASTGTV